MRKIKRYSKKIILILSLIAVLGLGVLALTREAQAAETLFADSKLSSSCTNYNPLGTGSCGGGSYRAFKTIQGAVDAASDNDTINVRAGTYTYTAEGNGVVISKNGITLQAYNSETVRITGDLVSRNWSLVTGMIPEGGSGGNPNITPVDATGKGVYKISFPNYKAWTMSVMKDGIPRKVPRLSREDNESYEVYNSSCNWDKNIIKAWYDVIVLPAYFETMNNYIVSDDIGYSKGYVKSPMWNGIEVMFHAEPDKDVFIAFKEDTANPNDYEIRVADYEAACIKLIGNSITVKGFDIDTCQYGVEINGQGNTVDNLTIRAGETRVFIHNSSGSNIIQNNEMTMSNFSDIYQPGSWGGAPLNDWMFYADRHTTYGWHKAVGSWDYSNDNAYMCTSTTVEQGINLSSGGNGNIIRNNHIHDTVGGITSSGSTNTEISGNRIDHLSSIVYGDSCNSTLYFHDNFIHDVNILFRPSNQSGVCHYYFYNNRFFNPQNTGSFFKQTFQYGSGGPASLYLFHNTLAGGGSGFFQADRYKKYGIDNPYINTYIIDNIISTEGIGLEPWGGPYDGYNYPTPTLPLFNYNWLGSTDNILAWRGANSIWSCDSEKSSGCRTTEPQNMWETNTKELPDFKLQSASGANSGGFNLDNSSYSSWPGIEPNYWGGGPVLMGTWNDFSPVPCSGNQALSAPTGLKAQAVSHKEIKLTWDLSRNCAIQGFNIYRCQGSSCTPADKIASRAGFNDAYLDQELAADTTYSYRIKAYDAAGIESNPSNSISVKTQKTPPALIAHWKFDHQGADDKAMDSSAYGHHGNIMGAEWTTAGHDGGALFFNGSDDKVLAFSPKFNLNKFTIAAWINASSFASGFPTIFSQGAWDAGHYSLYLNNSRKLSLAMEELNPQTFSGTTTLTASKWYFIAGTYDGSTRTIYLYDEAGNLQTSSATVSGTISSDYDPVVIGNQWQSNNNYFSGKIDEVRVYNKALSATEIEALFNGETPDNPADVNNSGSVDSADLQLCVNVILDIETDPIIIARAKAVVADMQVCDSLDLTAIVNKILFP